MRRSLIAFISGCWAATYALARAAFFRFLAAARGSPRTGPPTENGGRGETVSRNPYESPRTETSWPRPWRFISAADRATIVLGSLQSVMSAGAVVGGLIISAWGGPKRKIRTGFCCMMLTALLGRVWFGLGHDLVSWLPGAFFLFPFIPISNGTTAAIWMAKTPPDVQGRVLATRRFAAQFVNPLAALVAGPLAERLFEPAMMPGGALAATFGGLVGSGPAPT